MPSFLFKVISVYLKVYYLIIPKLIPTLIIACCQALFLKTPHWMLTIKQAHHNSFVQRDGQRRFYRAYIYQKFSFCN